MIPMPPSRPASKKIRASIIIPTFNEEKNVAACLAALSNQSVPRGGYELIVSDGYSTDKTVSIAGKAGARVVFEKKQTISAGRQKGAEAARGEILVFTDADTRFGKNWLGELLKPLADGRVACAYGALMPLEEKPVYSLLCRFFLDPYFRLTAALGLPSGAGSNMAVRARAFKKTGGFDRDLVTGEDIELQKRLKKFGKIVFAPNAVARVSFRRVEKWGWPRFFLFHASNFLKTHFLGTPAREYERVR